VLCFHKKYFKKVFLELHISDIFCRRAVMRSQKRVRAGAW
jgi:hypothetical protein